MKSIITTIFVSFVLIATAFGQSNSMRVVEYETENFPAVKAKLFSFDENGKVRHNLKTEDFGVSDNGIPLTLQYVSCPPPAQKLKSSIVLSLDKGISAGDTSRTLYKLAVKLLDSIAQKIDYDNSKVAVTSFDLWSYLMIDYTSDKSRIENALGLISSANSSSCFVGLNSIPAGALQISASGTDNRSVVYVTQGIVDFDANLIINEAKASKTAVYIIYLDKTIPNDLKRICVETGGNYFDKVNINSKIMPIVYSIVNLIEGEKPCEFMWYGNHDCTEMHQIQITDKISSVTTGFDFVVSEMAKPTIFSNPLYLEYSSVPIGESLTQDITIQAINSDIIITKLSIGNPVFQITQGDITSPKIVYRNTTHTMSITYTPIDSAIIFTKLIIESNACFGKEIYITGGFPNRPPKTKTIDIISPVCGETLVIGDTAEVRWQGLLPKDVIQLEYSMDQGANWYALAKNTENLAFDWLIPHSETDKLLIRAIQMWPNNVGRTLDLKHRGAVNSAFFNKKGDRVITAGDDSCAIIWNSNNGEKLHTLYQKFGKVNYAVFDQSGKFAFTACTDGHIYMYDAETGTLVRTFRHDASSEVFSVEVSPSKDEIVSVAKDKTVYIWSMNGPLLKQIPLLNDVPLFAAYDKEGEKILVTSQSGLARFYDAKGNLINSFDTKETGEKIAYSRHGTFNNDGKKISVVNDPSNSAFIFDVATGKKLYELNHFLDDSSKIYINSTSFFYNPDDDTEYLLTAGTDNSVRRWLANDGSIPKGLDGKDTLHMFKEHKKPVLTAVFNFDGSRLLTASWDSTAKIWNLNQRDLQMDTTDCYLSIGRAKIEPININFGDVLIDDVAIMTHGFIRNLKDFKFSIRSIRFFGGDIGDFKVIDEFAYPMSLQAGELKTLSIRFQPSAAGIRKTYAEIIIPNDTIIVEIYGRGVGIGLKASTSLIDFQKVEIDEFKDSTFTALLTNTSDEIITIDSVYLEGPDNEHYNIMDIPTRPIEIIPGRTIDGTFRFMPEALGRLNGIIVFNHNGKGSPTRINLFGNGVGTIRDTFELSLSPVQGRPGETVELPIGLKRLTDNGAFYRLNVIKTSLSFNSTMLVPIGQFESDVTNGLLRTITVNIPYNSSSVDSEYKIAFKVGLGNDSTSKIHLFDSKPIDNSKIIVYENSSLFRMLSICNEGGTRLFDPQGGRILLMQNKPNPFANTSTIEYEIVEKGLTKLTVFDMTGVPVQIVFEEWREAGAYSITLNADDFATGVYYYLLETPTQRFYRTMQVLK